MKQFLKKTGCGSLLFLLVIIGLLSIYLATQILILPNPSAVSETLEQLYTEDQAVRQAGIETPVDIIRFFAGDWIRVRKVRRIVVADLLITADDYANAASILQHGENSADYLQAQQLSLKAYELGHTEMRRHSALAEDRYLISIGQPQKYGTQFACEPETGWQISPVDPDITDEDRLQMDVEPLADMEAKIAELNKVTEQQCSLTQETMRLVETIMENNP